jgi:hypothetical protein
MNGFPIMMLGMIVLLVGGLAYWRRQKAWKVVYSGMELTEQASDQFALLQDNGIRCRMRTEPLSSNHNAGMANHASEPHEAKLIVEIHRDDVKEAKRLLEQRVGGQHEFILESS